MVARHFYSPMRLAAWLAKADHYRPPKDTPGQFDQYIATSENYNKKNSPIQCISAIGEPY